MRRALKIDETSSGPDHPKVATRLNNLAALLLDTNRLDEAEPLMRRGLLIYLSFTRNTGHIHPHLPTVLGNYFGLLQAMAIAETDLMAKLSSLGPEAGFTDEEFQSLLARIFKN
ncbi:MAG: tetratricopeptide repeat protein [Candidatus Methylumidiphilus sp.]